MSENDKSLEIADQDWPASSYRFERGTVNADVICSPKAIHDPANKNGNQIKKKFLHHAVASVTPTKGRTGLPALRALCEEDED
jgi:hypothetical protein